MPSLAKHLPCPHYPDCNEPVIVLPDRRYQHGPNPEHSYAAPECAGIASVALSALWLCSLHHSSPGCDCLDTFLCALTDAVAEAGDDLSDTLTRLGAGIDAAATAGDHVALGVRGIVFELSDD